MVKHIVLFKLNEELNESEKIAAFNKFREGIMDLQEIIPSIKDINVAHNINDEEQFDICLDATFETLEDAKNYGKTPEHLKISNELKPKVKARACTDFNI